MELRSCFICKFFKECYPDVDYNKIDEILICGPYKFFEKCLECKKYEFDIEWLISKKEEQGK